MTSCRIHSSMDSVGTCARCGDPICERCVGEMKGSLLTCRKCLGLATEPEPEAAETDEQLPQNREDAGQLQMEPHEPTKRPLIMAALLLVSGLLLLYQQLSLPETSLAAYAGYDSAEEEARALECFSNLNIIAGLLKENRLEEIQMMRCPVHGQTYIIQQMDGDMVVIDPEPTATGFRDIRIARSVGIPELTPLAN